MEMEWIVESNDFSTFCPGFILTTVTVRCCSVMLRYVTSGGWSQPPRGCRSRRKISICKHVRCLVLWKHNGFFVTPISNVK